jgi:hypothetical protein
MHVAIAVMKKRHFQLDHLRLRYLYRIHIQYLEFKSQEINMILSFIDMNDDLN